MSNLHGAIYTISLYTIEKNGLPFNRSAVILQLVTSKFNGVIEGTRCVVLISHYSAIFVFLLLGTIDRIPDLPAVHDCNGLFIECPKISNTCVAVNVNPADYNLGVNNTSKFQTIGIHLLNKSYECVPIDGSLIGKCYIAIFPFNSTNHVIFGQPVVTNCTVITGTLSKVNLTLLSVSIIFFIR